MKSTGKSLARTARSFRGEVFVDHDLFALFFSPLSDALFCRVIIKYALLPFVPIIGDGNGDFGLFSTFDDTKSSTSTSFHFNFDETAYEYNLDQTPSPKRTFSPSDLDVMDQMNNNLISASDAEMFMRSVSEGNEKPKKKEEKEDDPFKKPSTIGTFCFFFLF